VDPGVQIPKPWLEGCLIVPPGQPVHAGSGVAVVAFRHENSVGTSLTVERGMPNDDAGEADKIQLHERRRKERVKRH
jgi:hypothetical protein